MAAASVEPVVAAQAADHVVAARPDERSLPGVPTNRAVRGRHGRARPRQPCGGHQGRGEHDDGQDGSAHRCPLEASGRERICRKSHPYDFRRQDPTGRLPGLYPRLSGRFTMNANYSSCPGGHRLKPTPWAW